MSAPDAAPNLSGAESVGCGALQSLRRRLLLWRLVCGAVAIPCFIALAALIFMTVDVVFILSDPARQGTPWTLIALGMAASVGLVILLLKSSLLAVAGAFERQAPELGSALTNAVQLASQPGQSEIYEVLRRQAVAHGDQQARRLAALTLAKRGVQRTLLVLFATVGLWGAVALLFPEAVAAVWPRFTDPLGDHPPYSRLQIEVTPGAPEVLYGGECEIHATASGMPVERLVLVARNAQGTSETEMFRRPDQSYFQSLRNLREPSEFWVTDGRARSLRHSIRVLTTPQIALVEMKAVFPEYTGLRPRKWELKQGDLQFLRRTKLNFRIVSNRPLREGRINLVPLMGQAEKQITLKPDPQNNMAVEGSISVDEAVAFAISVTDVDGLVSAESRRGRIEILKDRAPRIDVLQPGRHAVATPEISVPVSVLAEDDYGITQLLWYRALNGSVERATPMKFEKTATPGTVQANSSFNMKELGVKPGDRIEYFFEAADNWPDGPNVTTTRMFVLEIITAEQYQQIVKSMRARKALFEEYNAADNHLRRLLERARALRDLQKTAPGDAKQAREQAQALAAELEKYLNKNAKLLASGKDFDIETAFRERMKAQRPELEKLRDRLNEELNAGGSSGGGASAQLAEEVYAELEKISSQLHAKVGEPARHVAAVAHLLSRANGFAQLTEMQKELAQRSQRFSEQKENLSRLEQMELQEIAAAQQNIQERVRQLMDGLPELRKQLPDEPQYAKLKETTDKFIAAFGEAKIQHDLDQAAEKFSAMNGQGGRLFAVSAAEKMDKLVCKCSSMGEQGEECLKFSPSISGILGDSLAQILSAMSGGGGNGGSGYGMFGESVGLYGPDMMMPGGESGGGDENAQGGGRRQESIASDATEPGLGNGTAPLRVKLQRDARFPLQHRQLVGEYFRAISEKMQDQQ